MVDIINKTDRGTLVNIPIKVNGKLINHCVWWSNNHFTDTTITTWQNNSTTTFLKRLFKTDDVQLEHGLKLTSPKELVNNKSKFKRINEQIQNTT